MKDKLFSKARDLAKQYNLLEDTEKSDWLTHRLYIMKFTNSEKEIYISLRYNRIELFCERGATIICINYSAL